MYLDKLPPIMPEIPFSNIHEDEFGGTERMARHVIKNFINDLPNFKKYVCMTFPGFTNNYYLQNSGHEVIIWLHNFVDELNGELALFLNNEEFVKKVKFLIVVSEVHKAHTLSKTKLKEEQVFVLQNAIDRIVPNYEKFNNTDKVKIINLSSYTRGLDLLLASLKYIEEDFELEVFNSFNPDSIIYQKMNFPNTNDPRVSFYGFTPHETVMKHLKNAHIHAYPSTNSETSCIAQMEALASGCLTVVSNSQAMQETSFDYAKIFDIEKHKKNKYQFKNFEDAAKEYADLLTEAIYEIKNGKFDPRKQSEHINEVYGWDQAKRKWEELHSLL